MSEAGIFIQAKVDNVADVGAEFGRVVGGTIVNYDYLRVPSRLFRAFDCMSQQSGTVVSRDDNTDSGHAPVYYTREEFHAKSQGNYLKIISTNMGTDAEILIFDHETYLTAVVPAFIELFQQAQVAGWLEPFVKHRELQPELWDKHDLARYLAALKPDFSWAGDYDLHDTYGDDWKTRWSKLHSPQTAAPAAQLAEQINWLFEIAVSIKCVGAGQFVGRSWTVSNYPELLRDLRVRDDDRIVELLAALGKRGHLIGYQFGSGFEGINGWLDQSETAALATALEALPLPQYEQSFAAMQRFQDPISREYEHPRFSFEALSLSFVRTVARIAAREGHGLLWGNGVMSPEYYRKTYNPPESPRLP